MTPTARRLLLAALGLAASAAAAPAGWDNAANVTCCDGPIRRAFKAPEPAPSRTSNYTVQYEETSKFETVRVMKPVTVQEPVEVKVRSYYYEPVTTYTRRSYYDSCSGQCQTVDVPRTSYVRRDECRTETRYLEKVQMVPVEMVREIKEETPVYTYRGPTVRKYGPLQPAGGGPTVDQFRGTPRIETERGGGSGYITPPGVPSVPQTMPKAKDEVKSPARTSDYRFNALSTSYTKESGAKVFGEVMAADRKTPLSNAKLVFVNASNLDDRKYVTADGYGGFDAKLPAGEWIVYAGPGTGKAERISTFAVKDGDKQELGVVTK